MVRICKYCNKELIKREISHHSPWGHHFEPFVELHDKCHKKLHSNPNWAYSKINQKWIKEIEDEYCQSISLQN